VEQLKKEVEGRILFKDVTFSVRKNDKIAFLSRDPLAISYFFEIINKNVKADGGSFEWGTTITSAYLPVEHNSFFTESLTLMDWLRQFVPAHVTDVDEPFIRGFFRKNVV